MTRRLSVIICLLAFIAMGSAIAEAAASYRHTCRKCDVSVVDKKKSGPPKVRCPKGRFHSWVNTPLSK